jgi:hypothetical protein
MQNELFFHLLLKNTMHMKPMLLLKVTTNQKYYLTILMFIHI